MTVYTVTAAPFGGTPLAAAFTETTPATVLWRDAGTTASWSGDGNGGFFDSGAGNTSIQPDPLNRLGQSVVRSRLTGPGGCRAFRWRDSAGQPIPVDAWFSSYLYIPAPIPALNWWNTWQTKTNPNSNTGQSDPKTQTDSTGSSGSSQRMRLMVCSQPPGCSPATTSPFFLVPTGRWVLMEVHQLFATTATGFIEIYVEGTKAAELRNIATQYPTSSAQGRQVSWNNYTDDSRIGTTSIYHGKATISASRVTDMPVLP